MATGKGTRTGLLPCVSFHRVYPFQWFLSSGKGRDGDGDGDGRSKSPCEATAVTDRGPSAPSQRPGDPERSIFVRLREGGYRLRDRTLFHLYVSTSPCGDARLNSPYEVTAERKTTSLPVTQPPPPRNAVPGCLCRPGARRRASDAGRGWRLRPRHRTSRICLSPGPRARWPETRNELSLPVPAAL